MVLEIIIIIFLILLGIALLMAEIFLLPGITIAGIVGTISLLGSIVYAFMYVGEVAGYITILTVTITFVTSLIYLVKSKAMNRIALETDINSVVDQKELMALHIGDVGKSISRLNPIGKAEFNNTLVEAKSFLGEFIDEGEMIEIVKIDPANVLVKLHEIK